MRTINWSVFKKDETIASVKGTHITEQTLASKMIKEIEIKNDLDFSDYEKFIIDFV